MSLPGLEAASSGVLDPLIRHGVAIQLGCEEWGVDEDAGEPMTGVKPGLASGSGFGGLGGLTEARKDALGTKGFAGGALADAARARSAAALAWARAASSSEKSWDPEMTAEQLAPQAR